MRVVIVNCFDTYQHRVALLSNYFSVNSHCVTQIRSDFSHRTKQYISCESSVAEVTWIHAPKYTKNLSVSRLVSHKRFAKDCFAWLEAQDVQPDLLWVLLPPNSLAKECAKYKKSHTNVKVIFDLIDLWPETFPVDRVKWLPPFQLWRKLRDSNLQCADHIVTECELYRSRLGLDDGNSSLLYMCKQGQPSAKPVVYAKDTDGISLCYLGSINHIIDIDAIAAIIRQIREECPVTLHIIGDGESRDALVSASKEAGASVQFYGQVFDEVEKQKIMSQCHFGLNVMKPSVCVGLTMKSIDYLAYALPLINTIQGDTWDLIVRDDFGVNWREGQSYHWSGQDYASMAEKANAFFYSTLTEQRFYETLDGILADI